MTKNVFLDCLKCFTKEAVKDMLLPVKQQKEDAVPPEPRPPEVFLMRLPDGSSYTKKAPYILHQIISFKDIQETGQAQPSATAVVRSPFCIYSEDEQEGSLLLLNVMERVRIALLEQVVIGKQFKLDLTVGIEAVIYPEIGPPPNGTAPFYLGEMITTWKLPSIERKVTHGKNYSDYRGSGYPGAPGGRH